MSQINAYIHFNGNCREAMEFYKECLGGELTMQTIGESPIANQMPPEAGHKILHSYLSNGDLILLGSDMIGPEGFIKGNTMSLNINCKSEEEINHLFSSLSSGGKITHQLAVMFWGGLFGTFNDKYGIEWMLNYDKNTK